MVLPSIEALQATLGARIGLVEPTATGTWNLGELAEPADLDERLRERVASIWPPHSLPQVLPHEWPGAFLHGADRGGPGLASARWCVALAIAIQRQARDPVGWGTVHQLSSGRVVLALPWQRRAVLTEALRFGASFLTAWLAGTAVDLGKVQSDYEAWLTRAQANAMTPSTFRFALAALARDIPLGMNTTFITLGWGAQALRMESSFTSRTSNMATRAAKNKIQTSHMLYLAGIPVPSTSQVASWEGALEMAGKLGWPVVIKPTNQDQGLGVVPGIRDEAGLRAAFDRASKLSNGQVIVEKHVEGQDHRMLVVGGRLFAAARREPARVTGDGVHSVAELVAVENRDPRRGSGKRSMLITIELDDEADECLGRQSLSRDAVPDKGRVVVLRRTANLSTGGTPVDVTAQVHPDNRLVAERSARTIGLDIAGVDFLCADITRSWREVGGAVCEVNAQPGFRTHWISDPQRDINGEIVDWLFQGRSSRVPVVGVIGAGAADAAASLVHRAWCARSADIALSSSHELWLGPQLLVDKLADSFAAARLALQEPSVQGAVLQLHAADLARFGTPCDRFDVLAVTRLPEPGAALQAVRATLVRAGRCVLPAGGAAALGLPAVPGKFIEVAAPDGAEKGPGSELFAEAIIRAQDERRVPETKHTNMENRK